MSEAVVPRNGEPARFRVVGAYVTYRARTGNLLPSARGGYTVVGAYQGAILPEGVPVEDLERLLRKGLIEVVVPVPVEPVGDGDDA